jgi:hypothetical protein
MSSGDSCGILHERTSVYRSHRRRFPAAIISHRVWLYFRFTLSFRDVEEMLATRGISLNYETVRKWRLKFGQTSTTACVSSHLDLATDGISTKPSGSSRHTSKQGGTSVPPAFMEQLMKVRFATSEQVVGAPEAVGTNRLNSTKQARELGAFFGESFHEINLTIPASALSIHGSTLICSMRFPGTRPLLTRRRF